MSVWRETLRLFNVNDSKLVERFFVESIELRRSPALPLLLLLVVIMLLKMMMDLDQIRTVEESTKSNWLPNRKFRGPAGQEKEPRVGNCFR